MNTLLVNPKQKRSKASVKAIEDAVFRIVLNGDLKSMTTNSVAKEANIDIKVLYRYFASKETLALHVLQKIVAGIDEQVTKEMTSERVRYEETMWWGEEALKKRVFIALMHSYTPEINAYIQKCRKIDEDRNVKKLKLAGARGRPADWRVSLQFLTYIYDGMLKEVSNAAGTSRPLRLKKRTVDDFKKTSAIILSQYLTSR